IRAKLVTGVQTCAFRSPRQPNSSSAFSKLEARSWKLEALMSLWHDLRFGVRLLVKGRWFTLAAIVALALGIGANVTIFTIVNAEIGRASCRQTGDADVQ